MKLKELSEFLGFTGTEISILFFLVISFFIGITVRFFNADELRYKEYDYSVSDSLFLYGPGGDAQPGDSTGSGSGKVQVFRRTGHKKPVPAEKSINLNSATIDQLMSLPGIGEKTAGKIIELRTKKGGFGSIGEIKEVKGIQTKKFERIKDFIFVEK